MVVVCGGIEKVAGYIVSVYVGGGKDQVLVFKSGNKENGEKVRVGTDLKPPRCLWQTTLWIRH